MEKLEKTAAALRRRGFDAAILKPQKRRRIICSRICLPGKPVGLRRLHDRQTDGT